VEFRKAMIAELDKVTGGLLKERRKNEIRERYEAMIKDIAARINQADTELRNSALSRADSNTFEGEKVRQNAAAELTPMEREIEMIRSNAAVAFAAEKIKSSGLITQARDTIKKLEEDYHRTVEQRRSQYETEKAKALNFFSSRRAVLDEEN